MVCWCASLTKNRACKDESIPWHLFWTVMFLHGKSKRKYNMFIVDYEVAAEISKATTRAEQDRMSISVKDKCQKFRRHEAASVETATQTHDVSSHQRFWQKKETQWLRKALSSRFSGWACRPVLCLLTRWSTMSDHKCQSG
jgi:hypothetical protein